MMHYLSKLAVVLLTAAIRLYQQIISPLLPGSCRYTPTCSEYSITVLREWGVLKGLWLTVRRISRCHPCGGFGYDPAPKK